MLSATSRGCCAGRARVVRPDECAAETRDAQRAALDSSIRRSLAYTCDSRGVRANPGGSDASPQPCTRQAQPCATASGAATAQRRSCRLGLASPAAPAAPPAARRPAFAAAASAPRSAISSIAAVCANRFSAVTMNGRTRFTCGSRMGNHVSTRSLPTTHSPAQPCPSDAPPLPTRCSAGCRRRWRRPASASRAQSC